MKCDCEGWKNHTKVAVALPNFFTMCNDWAHCPWCGKPLTEELKPCPFCGRAVKPSYVTSTTDRSRIWYIDCECGARMLQEQHGSQLDITGKWNRRA